MGDDDRFFGLKSAYRIRQLERKGLKMALRRVSEILKSVGFLTEEGLKKTFI